MNPDQGVHEESSAAFELLLRRYGDRLTPDMAEGLRSAVESVVRTLAALRSVKLENGETPLTGFTPEPPTG